MVTSLSPAMQCLPSPFESPPFPNQPPLGAEPSGTSETEATQLRAKGTQPNWGAAGLLPPDRDTGHYAGGRVSCKGLLKLHLQSETIENTLRRGSSHFRRRVILFK